MAELYFYTKESNPYAPRILTHNSEMYSPFTGEMRNIEHARQFLKENGKFWKERNQNLILFQEGQAIGYADGDKLMMRYL